VVVGAVSARQQRFFSDGSSVKGEFEEATSLVATGKGSTFSTPTTARYDRQQLV
jgi:hypothetical protein